MAQGLLIVNLNDTKGLSLNYGALHKELISIRIALKDQSIWCARL